MIQGKKGSVERTARSPLDVGDVDGPERRPASVSVHRRCGTRRPSRPFRSWSIVTVRWSWESAARSSGIRTTRMTRSRPTFLVLVRKARSIQVRESLAPWLYSVAYRTAQRARALASRYRHEGVEQVEALGCPPEDSYHLDLRPLLHEELDRLPDKYRAPIVLCHLEGKTHEEAARLLHWPIGTVSGRLSRGRELLKSRLERRGVAVPSAIFSASSLNLAQSIPISLVESTLTAAIRFAAAQSVSTSVLALTHGVLRTMFLNKLKTVSLAFCCSVRVDRWALVLWLTCRTARLKHGTTEPAERDQTTSASPVPKESESKPRQLGP